MKEIKVTKKDNFTAIASILRDLGKEDLALVMDNEITLLENKAAKAKERAATKKATNDDLADLVAAALTDELTIIADITAKIEFDGVTTAKVQARLNKLVDNGVATKEQIFVGEGKDRRKLMAYKING